MTPTTPEASPCPRLSTSRPRRSSQTTSCRSKPTCPRNGPHSIAAAHRTCARREEIVEVSELIFGDINNGVYKCGFASSQTAYEDAYDTLFARLDWLEERLTTRRFLVGDTITQADIRLWTTLVRFDAVYHNHFKCNRNKLIEMPALWGYARDLFQTPGFGDTIDFDNIKAHYYGVHTGLNPNRIIPKGPRIEQWWTPHGREAIGGRPFGNGTPPTPAA